MVPVGDQGPGCYGQLGLFYSKPLVVDLASNFVIDVAESRPITLSRQPFQVVHTFMYFCFLLIWDLDSA